MKQPRQILTGPIGFTAEEIEQARAGNFAPAERRLKRELSLVARRSTGPKQRARSDDKATRKR